MHKGRLEAFSDGVIAIITAIMVLEMKVPHGVGLSDLRPVLPALLSYILSYIYVGIYWNNHHHLFQAVERVDGRVLWSNLHLPFWLSLFPFVTAWIGENSSAVGPVAIYGAVLFMAGVAYFILVRLLQRLHDEHSALKQGIGNDRKGRLSIALYAAGIAIAFYRPHVAIGLYIFVAALWLIPDPRIEARISPGSAGGRRI